MTNTSNNGALVNITFENLTPHDINLILPDGEVFTIPATGVVARVDSHVEQIGHIGAIPVINTVFELDSDVIDLPDPQDGVIFITSMSVAQVVTDRTDVLVPADLRRDDAGRIIGAGALQRID